MAWLTLSGRLVQQGADLRKEIEAKLEEEIRQELEALRQKLSEATDRAVSAEADLDELREAFIRLKLRYDDLAARVGDDLHGLAVLDPEGRYLYINAVGARFNGRPVEEHIGRHVKEVLPGLAETIDPLLDKVIGSMEAHQGVFTDEDMRSWSVLYKPVISHTSDGPMGIGMIGHFKLLPAGDLI